MKNFILASFLALISFSTLPADVVKITEIDTIKESIDADTLVLFNIAEVLMDTETSLA